MQNNQENALIESYPETPEESMRHQKLYIMGLIPEILYDIEDEFYDDTMATIEFKVRRGCSVETVKSTIWRRLNMLLTYYSQKRDDGSLHLGFTTNPNNGDMVAAKFTASADGYVRSAVFIFFVSADILKHEIDEDMKRYADDDIYRILEQMEVADYGFLFYSGDSEEFYFTDEG